MKWHPPDIIALGLLIFIFAYLTFVFVLRLKGFPRLDSDGMDVAKDIIIYILGVLSGYIGIKKIEK